jgi:hypothetical protein
VGEHELFVNGLCPHGLLVELESVRRTGSRTDHALDVDWSIEWRSDPEIQYERLNSRLWRESVTGMTDEAHVPTK